MKKTLKEQIDSVAKPPKQEGEYEGNLTKTFSTGSTLLDLAISGGRVRGGGIPAGILVEIFGPSGSGKTVLLSEIAGAVQRAGGSIMFRDPEARLNEQFAAMFGLKPEEMDYAMPHTVPELFIGVRDWEPEGDAVHGVFADSLAALSTDLEMGSDDGDKMGMRRAKEFSEELRRTCRVIKKRNLLMVCSNQIRINVAAGPFGQKYTTPGGLATEFYSSLRIRLSSPKEIKKKITVEGKPIQGTVGVEVRAKISKSSIDKPFREAPLTIIMDYGVDDIRENLKYLKDFSGGSVYMLEKKKLSRSLDKSIIMVEKEELEDELRGAVIKRWYSVEKKFESERKPKKR